MKQQLKQNYDIAYDAGLVGHPVYSLYVTQSILLSQSDIRSFKIQLTVFLCRWMAAR